MHPLIKLLVVAGTAVALLVLTLEVATVASLIAQP